jgi:hypothetical protein|tara:strand:+ start:37402 stop:37560 length:159 start_codon:yes stop_codon:yes gene_type:complete
MGSSVCQEDMPVQDLQGLRALHVLHVLASAAAVIQVLHSKLAMLGDSLDAEV